VTQVLVIGKELCGFAAGALLAHAGRKVVMLDDGEDGGTRPLGEWLVPTAPSLWSLPETGHAAKLMDALGLRARAREELGERVGVGLIDDPDVRMEVFVDAELRLQELQRVFGEDGPVYDGFFKHLETDARDALLDEAARLDESVGFFNKNKIKSRQSKLGTAGVLDEDKAVQRMGEDGLGAAARQLAPLVQNLLQPPAGIAGYLSLVQLARGTVGDTRRGFGMRGSLRALFADVITGHGGVFENGRVTSAKVDKRVRQVVTDSGRTFDPEVVVDATTLRSLTGRLPESKSRQKTRAMESAVPFSGASAVVRWIVDESLLPPGLPARTVLLSDDEISRPPVLLGVFRNLPREDGERDEGETSAAIVAAARGRQQDSEGLAQDVRARLRALLPFVEPSHQDELIGDDARGAFPAYAQPADGHLLLGRRPLTAYANLFRAGRDLAPPLGLGGELASARAVAGAVERALGNKKPQMAI
jgi:phytoene dehydrogenase-like protein